MAPGMPLASSMDDSVTQILLWGGVLVLAVVVLFGGVWYYRRWWLRRDEGPAGEAAWTLDDLRRMRSEGQITEEEYEALRAALVSAFRGEKGVGGADKAGADFDLRKGPPG